LKESLYESELIIVKVLCLYVFVLLFRWYSTWFYFV